MTNEQFRKILRDVRTGWVAGHLRMVLDRNGELPISAVYVRMNSKNGSTPDEVVRAIELLDCQVRL